MGGGAGRSPRSPAGEPKKCLRKAGRIRARTRHGHICGEKGVGVVARYERICTRCGKTKTVDMENKKRSDWYIEDGRPKAPCKKCQNKKTNERRIMIRASRDYQKKVDGRSGNWIHSKVTVTWCPRGEWPNFRYFAAGQFETMLEDGVCTPGMCVTQHDKQYIVWGPKGEEQWL